MENRRRIEVQLELALAALEALEAAGGAPLQAMVTAAVETVELHVVVAAAAVVAAVAAAAASSLNPSAAAPRCQ